MAYDALYDQFTKQAMISLTDTCNAATDNFTREEQDAFAAESHQRAAAAQKNGVFDEEIVPVTIASRRGDTVVSEDEGVRADTTVECSPASARSPRTAPSPPARPRRSPTAPVLSS